MLALLLFSAFPVAIAADSGSLPVPVCDDGYTRVDSFCYKAFDTAPITWKEAEAACVKEGGHLTTVVSRFEAEQLFSVSTKHAKQPLANQPWIGYFYEKGPKFTEGIAFFKGITFVEREMTLKDGICGKFLADNGTDHKGASMEVIQVPCTSTSTRYICKRINCPRATSFIIPLTGRCACNSGFRDIMITLTPEENYKMRYGRGEYCIKEERKTVRG